ncbi:MAG: ANTAR domain-containing protein [Clostridia bacterium]|nr:ANTAR domain-containing protein [Clostridia bacterium]MBQ9945202.1 ANTAR domain-containing protein [Clostridia bacterium]
MDNSINILVASGGIKFYNSLLTLIPQTTGIKAHFANSSSDAKRILLTHSIQAVIVNTPLSDGFGLDFAINCAVDKDYPLLMLISKDFYEQVNLKTVNTGILTLQKPTSAETLSQSLNLLTATAKKLRSFRTTDGKENASITQLKVISRAKLILIGSFSMTEEQAHKYIERRAMESRKSKLSIAEAIINSYGV